MAVTGKVATTRNIFILIVIIVIAVAVAWLAATKESHVVVGFTAQIFAGLGVVW